MADEARITYASQVATLRETFASTDKVIYGMFQELDKKMEGLHVTPDTDLYLKFDRLIAIEYLIVRVRSRVMTELSNVQAALSASGGTSVDKILKERYNTVILLCQRLNELRDDIAVIQRSMYSRTFGRA